MMPRNLNRRVELAFPVQDHKLVRHIRDEVLGTYLQEVVKARHMNSDGTYTRDPRHTHRREHNSQELFLKQSAQRSTAS